MSKKQELYPNCLQCSTPFKAIKSNIEKGKAKYCSQKCAGLFRASSLKRPNKECKECHVTYYPSHTYNKGFCSKKCADVSRRGIPTGRRITYTDELRRKISDSQKQRFKIIPPYNRGVKLPQRSGVNHHNWQGGITNINRAIRNSLEYKQWRKTVFERDDYTCQFCHKKGGILHADHIKPFAIYPDLRLDTSNGRTLCAPCHRTTDTYSRQTKALEMIGC
jgi:5-methylcytosine-specific restriction endonuclease McrA